MYIFPTKFRKTKKETATTGLPDKLFHLLALFCCFPGSFRAFLANLQCSLNTKQAKAPKLTNGVRLITMASRGSELREASRSFYPKPYRFPNGFASQGCWTPNALADNSQDYLRMNAGIGIVDNT